MKWDCLYRDFVIYLPYIESKNPNCAYRLMVAYTGVKDAYLGSRPHMHPQSFVRIFLLSKNIFQLNIFIARP